MGIIRVVDASEKSIGYKIDIGSTLRFVLPYGSFPFDVTVDTNYTNGSYKANSYHQLKTICPQSEFQFQFDLPLQASGVFQFRIKNVSDEVLKIVYINVYPLVHFSSKKVPVSGLSVQTHITRLMGKISEWESHYQTLSNCGYNAIHLTPLQPIGPSGSAYSLVQHLDIEDSLFDEKLTTEEKIKRVGETVKMLRNKYEIASIIDVVLSHVSSHSQMVVEHPEICYTTDNCPHLKVGYAFDSLIHKCIDDIINSNYNDNLGMFNTPEDVKKFIGYFKEKYMIPMQFWLYYVIDVEKHKLAYIQYTKENPKAEKGKTGSPEELAKRMEKYVQTDGTYEKNHITVPIKDVYSLVPGLDEFLNALDVLNVDNYRHYDNDVNAAIQNCLNNLMYSCFDPNGPHVNKFTREVHILPYYFQVIDGVNSKNEKVHLVAAHHGWIFGGDPFFDFVGDKSSKVYIRREAIVWEDSLKLNYGTTYKGHEYIWDHMKEYVCLNAKLFDGLRLDNCHSVPLPALEYILNHAREVNQNLIVLAELFADNADAVIQYVVRCGIQGLVKEALRGKTPSDLNGVAYQSSWFKPVGGILEESVYDELPADVQPMDGWTYDLTHDNEPQEGNRNPNDSLSTSAVVAMTIGTIGSVRGYDELVPFKISCVTERRLYKKYDWNDLKSVGISKGKSELNKLHERLAIEGYSEFYGEINGNLVILTRRNPKTHKVVIVYAHTSFLGNNSVVPNTKKFTLKDYKVDKFLFFGALTTGLLNLTNPKAKYISGNKCICDFTTEYDVVNEFVTVEDSDNCAKVEFKQFPAGSVLAVQLDLINPPNTNWNIPKFQLKPQDLFNVFFGTPEEVGAEKFEVFHHETLGFVGLGGVLPLLVNDLSQPIYEKLRNGGLDHIAPYITQLVKDTALGQFTKSTLLEISRFPKFLIPKYFAAFIKKLFASLVPSTFESRLELAASQFYSDCKGTPLIANGLVPASLGIKTESLCAGIPHFLTGYMRNWGRDTFIALRGILLRNGRFEEAENTIRAYLCAMSHGLIPNLLDGCVNSRYNARDATWFCMSAIVDYCEMVPHGESILDKMVYHIETTQEVLTRVNKNKKREMTVRDVMQSILEMHANGIHFREKNAGPKIDSVMTSKGFDIDITLNPETGFISGGNEANCGTWMDKMGSSTRAGNCGQPGSSRDGADVEIQGLLMKVLHWINTKKVFQHEGVRIKLYGEFTYEEWENKLQANFSKYFYIPSTIEDDKKYEVQSALVNKREIYKDVVGSIKKWPDYQLRPNFLITLVEAPSMFVGHEDEVKSVLKSVRKLLVGPLGMKTLDPTDWSYKPNYYNEDSDDYSTANGLNYHNGPEWVWPYGYYVMAMLMYNPDNLEKDKLKTYCRSLMFNHFKYVKEDKWMGLPELTNCDGHRCYASCVSQAWSVATLLDATKKVEEW
ncbi:glycogen debranching enzyme, putative [Entamoeba invadens IP1]|uniref:Glycogen debranching enzyme, putative n=1 Tax=Entamoeba invadens IP1 TaxID=370355 RepID=A0A0A1U014_ENTIV|nr:glycogen debranching enzyme, putative [Entamoeba invadens IP1]ELP84233.1 glycogen debranching enzyme, putative [Entamoeba invadens IP1]|eukprot:XP_004183579.1 glycogen debranching enzyme, putative [Entamoeba invadens IP1]